MRKYYELATFTANKPPRIDRFESRLDKLEAFLEKFQDLNTRILVCVQLHCGNFIYSNQLLQASYDKLERIELEARLSNARARARHLKAEETAHQRKVKLQERLEKRRVDELKRDIQELRERRTDRLMGLHDHESLASPVDSESISGASAL